MYRAGKAAMSVPLHSAVRSGCMGRPMWKGRLKRWRAAILP
ncbi:hypothetical protein NEISICOT_02941 [Neisseria sicca ATCC 29256]|uniref:Uncharacterized protein n=1 Tax=Neisseria sicca ATCC 29256 TaxID=547045 RepID=C6M8R6_NEISI|nr:hypothetical protein NEISICOT_03462 [Neisseria sicca ATCC 29256]EET43251.1 hypothetical protein NEISICOT_02941 [Neisseria sicca ATCC 29256]